MSLTDDFKCDSQGQRFADVWKDNRLDFNTICNFFDNPDRQRRMIESELHHDRPALAGVIREFESQPLISAFFRTHGRKATGRFRQAVGVVTRIVMQSHNWKTTRRKGSLGTPAKSPAAQRKLGGRNKGGLATWFNRAERYTRA